MKNIAIVGSGSISLMTAFRLVCSEHQAQITIYEKPNSKREEATQAAGAMEAVFGEVEDGFEDDLLQKRLIANGMKVRAAWDEIYDNLGLDLITAKDTIVFLNKGANSFETKNYNSVISAAKEFDELEFVDPEKYFLSEKVKAKESVIRLKRERGFNARLLIERLRIKLVKSGVHFKQATVSDIDPYNNVVLTSKPEHSDLTYDKIILAAGASASELLPSECGVLPILRGIGLALLCEGVRYTEYVKSNSVYRSVNRGGSQCGLHLVPEGRSAFYIGAGNRLSWSTSEALRFDTIRYLMNETESDLFGKSSMYSARGNILTGDRARSVDYLPLLGPLSSNSNIIVASGFNRIGLTMSPLIADDILRLLNGDDAQYFTGYLPDRTPEPYGTMEQSAQKFSEVTCANLIEHDLIENELIADKLIELEAMGIELNGKINSIFGLPNDFGHTPDALSVLAQYK